MDLDTFRYFIIHSLYFLFVPVKTIYELGDETCLFRYTNPYYLGWIFQSKSLHWFEERRDCLRRGELPGAAHGLSSNHLGIKMKSTGGSVVLMPINKAS
jgi:hypothetical protein